MYHFEALRNNGMNGKDGKTLLQSLLIVDT